jgi:hypothetical protein
MSHRRAVTIATSLALVLAASVAVVRAAYAAVGCQVTYAVSAQWPGGFTGNISIRNVGDALTSWTLRWTFAAGQTVTQGWNGNYSQSGTQVTVTNASWNGSVPTNGSVATGFNGSWNNATNPVPTSFLVNGTICTGSVTNPPTTTTAPTTTRPPTTTTGPPTTTTTTRPPTTTTPPPGQVCTAFGTITMGKYWINNNLWGQSSGSGTQCVWGNSTSGDVISWGTTWNWSGQSNQVKSYSSSVLGWHWGWNIQNTGLPTQLSANRNVNTTWQYTVNASGTFNVAYDAWFHTIPNPTYENQPTDELMIWTYRAGGAGPAGTLQGRVTIAGTQWDLYRGVVGSWNVFSYVRVQNATGVSFNIRDFTNDLVARGWMANSKYLTSVQAGTEVFIGSGTLNTTSYSTTVS